MGGGITDADLTSNNLAFTIQNKDTGEYLNASGNLVTVGAGGTAPVIGLSDLDHTANTTTWSKTYTVPVGDYEVTETNYTTINSATGETWTFKSSSTTKTSDNTTVNKTNGGTLNLVNEYEKATPETGSLTVTKVLSANKPANAPTTYTFYVKRGNDGYVQDATSGTVAANKHAFTVTAGSTTVILNLKMTAT